MNSTSSSSSSSSSIPFSPNYNTISDSFGSKSEIESKLIQTGDALRSFKTTLENVVDSTQYATKKDLKDFKNEVSQTLNSIENSISKTLVILDSVIPEIARMHEKEKVNSNTIQELLFRIDGIEREMRK